MDFHEETRWQFFCWCLRVCAALPFLLLIHRQDDSPKRRAWLEWLSV